ncbi:hypothetical protein [Mesorhizobium retamae]|uniref:Glycosylase n=1 Tax=Mesorhizobium retamae TaxID=2912854 RepID=A0ABS9QFR6_9HYPH|nr:hypothetical protein [Mesorhizobium sp. IRAMC:0171]MCG7506283.1 hypothetical protein [Mesorhizobium sp. IRAMC:0171]
MRLHKLGKIFDPMDHDLVSGGVGFAQSPQVLLLEDRIRIYFSTRTRDASGKFLSHIAFVDFDRTLKNVLDVSRHEVIQLGALGTFDEHGIFPLSPFQDGLSIHAYTTGWSRRVSVSVETAVGYVRSDDGGRTFSKPLGAGPILTPVPDEPFLVGDAFVRRFEDALHMWYIFGIAWKANEQSIEAERVYKIGHGTSADGVVWRREAGVPIIADALGPDECQALPTVIRFDGAYHMFFCFREAFGFRTGAGRGYRIGHAVSVDLQHWCRDDTTFLPGSGSEWDSDMQCYPHAFILDGKALLLYNGNEFGRYGFGLAEIVA